MKGIIHFRHWPPADSVADLRLAALQNYPVDDLVGEVLQGRAQFTESLLSAFGLDSVAYTLLLAPLPPGRIPFVGVAQRFGPNVQTDWRVVGIYYAPNDTSTPGSVIVPPDSVIGGIDVTVDFLKHLPQP